MGIDMELDLSIGQIKPKATAGKQPAPEGEEAPEGALQAFTLLPEAEQQGILLPAAPAPEWPAHLPMMVPDETPVAATAPAPEGAPAIRPEGAAAIAPEGAAAIITAPEAALSKKAAPESIAAALPLAPAPALPVQPPARPARPEASAPAAAPVADEASPAAQPTENRRQPPAPAQQEKPAMVPATPAPTAPPVAPLPAQAPASGAPMVATGAGPAPLPDSPPPPPAAAPAQTMAKPTVQPLFSPAPASPDRAQEDPSTLQFGIRIERQALEIAPAPRITAPQPAPVANQIAAQLPQLLTKADTQTLELRLDPPELGRVTIHIKAQDQQIIAQVVADRPDTVDLMRRHADMLTSTLARAGFAQADLSFQQGQGQGQKEEFTQFQTVAFASESDASTPDTPGPAPIDGRLDIRL